MKNIDCKVLSKQDKILVYINKDVPVDETASIHRYMQKQFPDNKIIIIHSQFIDGIDILKERTEFDELLQPFENSLNS